MPRHSKILVAVDLVVLTVGNDSLQVLTVERAADPHKGRRALPGGFVLPDEGLLEAAERELVEETGLVDLRVHLEQIASYGHPNRDPRRVISVAYLALLPSGPVSAPGGDATAVDWLAVDDLLASPKKLAFDHHQILTDGVERARNKFEYSPLATAFCPDPFTINELRVVYEVVWGTKLDPRNFHRKVSKTPDFVIETGETTSRQGGRPAKLYRRGPAEILHPAMMRPE